MFRDVCKQIMKREYTQELHDLPKNVNNVKLG